MFSTAWRFRLGICALISVSIVIFYISLHFTIEEKRSWLNISPREVGKSFQINLQLVFLLAFNSFIAIVNFMALIELTFGKLVNVEQLTPIRGNLAIGLLIVFIITSLTALSVFMPLEIKMSG